MTVITKNKIKDGVERAAWTFAQAFLAVLLVSNEPFSKVAIISAAAAGISALKTFAKTKM